MMSNILGPRIVSMQVEYTFTNTVLVNAKLKLHASKPLFFSYPQRCQLVTILYLMNNQCNAMQFSGAD